MTDYWSRSGGSGQPDFEIELVGPDGSLERAAPIRDPDQPPARRWGAIVGLAVLGAIALVVVASVVIQITTDDGTDSADPASTTAQLDLAAPVPTERPATDDAGALSDFDTPETRYPPMVSAPTPTQQQIPGFPVVPGSADEDLSAYDLEAAVANNMPGAEPQRSMFNVVDSDSNGASSTTSNSGADTLRATAMFQPGPARDALTIQIGGDTARLVVDRAEQVVYRLSPEDGASWQTVDTQQVVLDTGTESLDALFDAFVTGPITQVALEHGAVTPWNELVRIMGGGSARRFDVEVPVQYLQPYGALLFANVTDKTVRSDVAPETITFQVYVTGHARLALVTANFDVGETTYVLSQFFDRKPANVKIDLPLSSDAGL